MLWIYVQTVDLEGGRGWGPAEQVEPDLLFGLQTWVATEPEVG